MALIWEALGNCHCHRHAMALFPNGVLATVSFPAPAPQILCTSSQVILIEGREIKSRETIHQRYRLHTIYQPTCQLKVITSCTIQCRSNPYIRYLHHQHVSDCLHDPPPRKCPLNWLAQDQSQTQGPVLGVSFFVQTNPFVV